MARRKLDNLSTDELVAELKRRQRRLPALLRKRKKILAQLEQIDAEINSVPGAATQTKGRKRPRNEMTLPEALAKVMSATKPMSIGQITEAVQTKAGYRSSAKDFRGVVSQALISGKQFKKKSRGMYVVGKK